MTKARKEADEAKKEADKAKAKLTALQADYDAALKSVEETKANLKKEARALQNQVANLQHSLQRFDSLKDDAVKNTREEVKKIAEDHINALKSKHDDDLVTAKTQGWNDASSAAADEMMKIKEILYKAGHEFGLESAGVVEGDVLFVRTVLPTCSQVNRESLLKYSKMMMKWPRTNLSRKIPMPVMFRLRH